MLFARMIKSRALNRLSCLPQQILPIRPIESLEKLRGYAIYATDMKAKRQAVQSYLEETSDEGLSKLFAKILAECWSDKKTPQGKTALRRSLSKSCPAA